MATFFPSYFHLWHLPIVFLAGLIWEGYGVVVGSWGILIQFVLLSLWMPLPAVIATDLAGCLGSITGVFTSLPKHTWWNKRLLLILAVPSFVGGIIGTIFLTQISPRLLACIVILGLFMLLIHALFSRQKAVNKVHEVKISSKQIPLIGAIMATLGFYANISGVWAGTFRKMSYMSLLKVSVKDSIGLSNAIDFPWFTFSFVVTAIAGLIVWPYLIALILGTYIGSRFAIGQVKKISDAYLRILLIFLTVVYLVFLISKFFR